MESLNYSLVEDDVALAQWAAIWNRQPVIGIDTEFVRTQTFYPEAGLIQIASPGHEVLIDPLKISDFAPLAAVFSNPAVTKVLHACGEDLEVFQRELGVLPQPVFDTQIAAAFLGMGLSVGYQRLVEAELGTTLPASETRSDWLQRPLSPSQLEYAAADAHCLLPLYQRLQAQLYAKGLASAAAEECDTVIEEARRGKDPTRQYLKLRGAWRLGRSRQQVLQALCVWREDQARLRNVPRSRVAADALLISMAQNLPNSVSELSRCEGIHHRQLKQGAEELLRVLREAQLARPSAPEESFERIARPLAKDRKELYGRLKARVQALSEALDIPESLLCKKAWLEKLTDSLVLDQPLDELPLRIHGWRAAVLEEPLRQELNAYVAEGHSGGPDSAGD